MPRAILLILMFALAPISHAEETAFNRVDFNIDATRKVTNDLLSAQMSIEVNDPSPARIAQSLNTAINAALKASSRFPAVNVSSGNHSTYPVYDKKNTLSGWRGNAQIQLESGDFKAAGELIGKLQQDLQLTGISFSVAPATRREVETALIEEALGAFLKRADTIRASLGGRAYKILHISLNQNGYQTRPLLGRAMMAMSEDAVAPDLAGGDSNLTVQVSGTIEVVMP